MASKTVLGRKIFELRRVQKLTQGDLAEKIGVSRAAISQFELGDTMPSTETQQKLSDTLGFDFSSIKGAGHSAENFFDYQEILSYFPIESYPSLTAAGGIYTHDDSNTHKVVHSKIWVSRVAGVDYERSNGVIEINGNSMAPRYPHGARYVIFPVSPVEEELRLLTGVCLFFLPYKPPFFRRVISNKGGVLTLKADATGEELELTIASLCASTENDYPSVYKLGQAVHMPAE